MKNRIVAWSKVYLFMNKLSPESFSFIGFVTFNEFVI
jgi:hypothetical protein